MGIPRLIYIFPCYTHLEKKKLSHTLPMFIMLGELRGNVDTINSLFSLFAIFFFLKNWSTENTKVKKDLDFANQYTERM